MRIQNNIMALNAHRQYNINQSGISKSTEKLSSGYRINRAGDDAAGLAISEKMRAQIRGLTMASKNSQDAISLVQTAEGALQETHNILQRMRELAVQSSSDSNETTIDRAALQQEYQNLLDEINDISTTTRFNDQNLLDGTFQKVLNTTNTTATTLSNVNALSVARSGAGEYKMSVASSEASASQITPGAACDVFASDMAAMAEKSAKVSSIDFTGLETGAHDGNTYTLKVTGSDIKNMTFQLLDSNGDVVSTAQNVNTSEWKAAGTDADGNPVANNAGNVVSFKGVGTLTFTLDEAVSTVTDLDTLSGATMNFMAEGEYEKHTITMASPDFSGLHSAINAGLDSGNVKVTFTAADDADKKTVMTKTGEAAPAYTVQAESIGEGKVTFSLLDADNKVVESKTVNVMDLTASSGDKASMDIEFKGFGTFTVANTADAAMEAKLTEKFAGSATGGAVAATDSNPTVAGSASLAGLTSEAAFDAASGTDAFAFSSTPAEFTDASGNVFSITKGSGSTLAGNDAGAWAAGKLEIAISVKSSGGTDGDMGKYTLTLDVAAGTTDAELKAAIDDALKGVTVTVAKTTDNFGKAAVTGASTSAAESITFDGAKAQEATPAIRASMTLTINGESVVLHKGDTYANFAEQGISFSFNALSDEDILNADYFNKEGETGDITIAVNGTDGKSLIIQSGANQGDELAINVDRISTETLGLSYSNISSHEAASRAITEVNNAINQVSTQRAALGALQNRLDHKIANLDTSAENLTAAEARIRDVDMAKEMTNFTKNNILFQASTAMLAQANAAPQGVLQLLG